MKYPMLKNGRLCQFVFACMTCFPILLGLAFTIIGVILADRGVIPGIYAITLFLIPLTLAIVFLIRIFGFIMFFDIAITSVIYHGDARLSYSCPKNGDSMESVLARVSRRLSHFGKEVKMQNAENPPITVRYRLEASATVFQSSIERAFLLFDADLLDEEGLNGIRTSSQRCIALARKSTKRAQKAKYAADPARVAVVFIVARKITVDVRQRLSAQADPAKHPTLVCAFDESTGRYYFDGVKENSLGCSEKSRGINLIRRIVFGGRIPLSGNTEYIPFQETVFVSKSDLDMSLWEFLRSLKQKFFDVSKQEKRKMARLAEGEVVYDPAEETVYCKLGGRAVAWLRYYDEDEEFPSLDNEKLVFQADEDWMYPKQKPLTDIDLRLLHDRIEARLRSEGYSVSFVDANGNEIRFTRNRKKR